MVQDARSDELLLSSEHGPSVLKILQYILEARDRKETEALALRVVTHLKDCIRQEKRAKLPSTVKSLIRHRFRVYNVSGSPINMHYC